MVLRKHFLPVVFAHTSLLSQLVVLPLSGQHRPPHSGSLHPKMGHMTSTLLVICRYTFYRTQPRESDTSLPLVVQESIHVSETRKRAFLCNHNDHLLSSARSSASWGAPWSSTGCFSFPWSTKCLIPIRILK